MVLAFALSLFNCFENTTSRATECRLFSAPQSLNLRAEEKSLGSPRRAGCFYENDYFY
jgi:hypothetical protein